MRSTFGLILLGVIALSFKIPKEYKKLVKEYPYIPMGEVVYHIEKDGKLIAKKDTLGAFYIQKNEVSNSEYSAFVDAMKLVEPSSYKKYLPDTTVWTMKLRTGGPFQEHYYSHPAYANYPVVGVNKKQAEAYCVWLSKELKIKYQGVNVKARLPKKKEWIRAARGNTTWAYALGMGLRNNKGVTQYNYQIIGDEFIHYNSDSMSFDVMNPTQGHQYDLSFITVPQNSYWENMWGLYNICGNVAEMIADEDLAMGGGWANTGYDIRVESTIKAEASYDIGFRVLLEIL